MSTRCLENEEKPMLWRDIDNYAPTFLLCSNGKRAWASERGQIIVLETLWSNDASAFTPRAHSYATQPREKIKRGFCLRNWKFYIHSPQRRGHRVADSPSEPSSVMGRDGLSIGADVHLYLGLVPDDKALRGKVTPRKQSHKKNTYLFIS
jgi:hypothetical protein